MKKFTSIAMAMLIGASGFSAMAQDLGEGTPVTSSFSMMGGASFNDAPTYASTLPTVLFYWGSTPSNPTKIYLVDPQQSSSMTPGMSNEYAPVSLTLPSGDEISINATISSPDNMGMGGGIEAYLKINLMSAASAGYGEYTITIPEGTVKNEDGDTNAESTYKVTYCKAGTASLTPVAGQYAPNDFNVATISFDGTFEGFVVSESTQIIKLVNNNTFQLVKGWTASEITVSDDKKSFSVDFDGLEIKNGDNYMIQVTNGSFIYSEEGIIYLPGQIQANYFIFDGLKSADILEAPSYYTSPYMAPIMMTWDWQNIYQVGESIPVTVSYYNEDYDTVTISLEATLNYIQKPEEGGEVTPAAESNNILLINLAGYLEDIYGYVSVTLPEGVIKNDDGKTNQEEEISFTICPLSNCEVIFDEEEPGIYYINWVIMDELSSLNLNYYGPYEMYVFNSEGEKVLSLYYDSWGEYWPTSGTFWTAGYSMINGQPTEVYADIEDLEDGIYTLSMPEGLFLLNVSGITYLSSEYNSDEIIIGSGESVVNQLKPEASVEGYVVYNLKGVKVLESNDGSALSGLAAGIYIINGKKVMIRK